MAEYDCNPVGGGQPPGLYQNTLSQRKKKKEAKLIVLRLSKQVGISFVKEWIVRWDVTAQEVTFLPCTPQHLPHPTQTNPIPSAQALRWKQRVPLCGA